MKKYYFAFFATLLFLISYSQDLNLSFENQENGLPKGYFVMGESNATLSFDKDFKKHGSQSFTISNPSDDGFKAIGIALPKNYAGKKITLSGFIKTENIENGFAGLWTRIDPSIAFENMQKNGIKGTTDWKQYEITLPLNPAKTKEIIIGALLVGKGKMWVDHLSIKIDDKDISKAVAYKIDKTKADTNNPFEKSSKISNLSLENNNIQNLKTVGLVWGYLKYYHPKAHSGDLNWDYELFKILPKVNNKTAVERDKILLNWIKSLGTYNVTKLEESTKNVKLEPDLEWIKSSGFSKSLSDELLKIKSAKREKSNYYIDFFPGVGNPEFKNENAYTEMLYPDEGYRLLALFRYWNIIQYFFPYKNLIEEDWKNVLTEFIPKFLNSKNQQEYTFNTLAIIARIHDTHANIWGKNETLLKYYGERYAPIELTFVGNHPVVSGFRGEKLGLESGLQKGDIITEIDGKSVEKIINEKLEYTPASNYPTQLRNIARNLLRSNSETINLKYIRNDKNENLLLKTFNVAETPFKKVQDIEFFKMMEGNIAYFYLGTVTDQKLKESLEKIKNTKGLVIDIRNYPSSFVVFKLGQLLKPNSKEFVKFSQTSNSLPGQFVFTPNLSVPGSGKDSYKGKIAILVNEATQSQAEYTTMAFRTAPNAKVFGSTTAGADGNVSEINLPGGITTMISGIGVYYPDGTETQRVGIVPDVEVKPTVEGIKSGKDEVLQKAMDWINK